MQGIRGHESEFYGKEYNFLSDAAEAEHVYETEAGRQGINDILVEFLAANAGLGNKGDFLEVGCGKGIFLTKFHAKFPGWSISALEPSENARQFLSGKIDSIKMHEGTLESFADEAQKFDLIAAIGVLEHVPQPKEFLRRICHYLKDNGCAFIMVPNFRHNPCDLGICDHLTRFTPTSFRRLLAKNGLRVVKSHEKEQVPMWAIARKSAARVDCDMPDELMDRHFVQIAPKWFADALQVYKQAGNAISGTKRKLGIFGTGTIFLSAVQENCLTIEDATVIFEDNPTLISRERFGLPIMALDQWNETGITDIIFSANPCYHKAMKERVAKTMGDKVKVWDLPEFKAD